MGIKRREAKKAAESLFGEDIVRQPVKEKIAGYFGAHGAKPFVIPPKVFQELIKDLIRKPKDILVSTRMVKPDVEWSIEGPVLMQTAFDAKGKQVGESQVEILRIKDVPDDILKELDAQTKAANREMERQRKENERREQQELKEHRKRKQRQDMYTSRPKKTREIIAETSHGNYTIKYELRSQAQITGRSRTFHRGGLVRSGSSFNLSLLKLKRALLKI